MEENTKVLRLSKEMYGRLSEMGNMSEAVKKLTDNYRNSEMIITQDENYSFFLAVESDGKKIPYKVTGVTQAYRVPESVYSQLMQERYLPSESLSEVLFRLFAAYPEKPFILEVGVHHTEIIDRAGLYSFSGEFELSDCVKFQVCDAEESRLIATDTGAVLKVFPEPFSCKFEYSNLNRMFCPDAMAYSIYLSVGDYEMKMDKCYWIPKSMQA